MDGVPEPEMKKPVDGENKTKRKMKTASQLELLEKTYAVETYPSESVRAELSVKLGLSDRQLQMWFCHRRLKDRKPPPAKKPRKDSATALTKTTQVPAITPPLGVGLSSHEPAPGDMGDDSHSASGSGSSSFSRRGLRRALPRAGSAVGRTVEEMASIGRCYEPQHSAVLLRAVTSIEAQLGGPLREDGPVLGVEFDPLPPDAFGAPIGPSKQAERFYDRKVFEQPDPKLIKGSGGVLHEYQFLPEQPSIRSDNYGRVTQPCYYSSAPDISSVKTSLSMGHSYMHGNDRMSPGYIFHNQISSLSLPGPQGHHGHLFTSVSGENEGVSRSGSFTAGTSLGVAPENQFIPFSRRMLEVQDTLRIVKKRKGEEVRIAKEVMAHEKRIRRELEKQELLRRKVFLREEQMRKEVERHDRERRKEEERLLREKQREVERYQREQRRELERHEKFLQRESTRAEKIKQKEELRREKEAAKRKAANDRAVARRISKESTELIEDERLELMELAVLKKGLPSIIAIDSETLQNLDMFRDALISFPPETVGLKKSFAVEPWVDSEENTGNLLMSWRFLIDFSDVIGLWAFTVDEFVQALHDTEARILNEVHIALLRCIIRDIEDVSRVPTGAVQTIAPTNSSGGHPRIIEGAYLWGFDICCWQRHLNLLTWPEVLRQLALSAGLGPKLKMKVPDRCHTNDENDAGAGCEAVVLDLRNGAAVENAVSIMQERGYTNSRRSRHKLTPGTVKFAAFHVLSVEGSRGLTILEVADRIQKSGLRDLSTSKTPEASIAAALSRDVKLFERTAPSTYCVRSPYRKDPADAEAIFTTARNRVQVFRNVGFDEEEADDKAEDSESDATEEPETDDLVTPDFDAPVDLNAETAEDCMDGADDGMDVDESDLGEGWVQALAHGEYADLSVEERLNVLVSLIGLALEGSSIRNVLEERLEAANALKKQMWADVQIDKRRVVILREDLAPAKSSSRAEQQTSSPPRENVDGERGDDDNHRQVDPDPPHPFMKPEKLRAQMKSCIGHKAEDMYVYRSLPLGQDRRRNRYWHFTASVSPADPCCGRIFVELPHCVWRVIDSEGDFDALLDSLDTRGVRESHLHSMLQKIEPAFKESVRRIALSPVEECSPLVRYLEFADWAWKEFVSLPGFSDIPRRSCRRLLGACGFCRDVYVNEDDRCPLCRCPRAGPALPTHLRIGMLKFLLASVELAVVPDAFRPGWTDETRAAWGVKLYACSLPEDLLRVMLVLEEGVRREYLATSYDTLKELLVNAGSGGGGGSDCRTGTVLPTWIPSTIAAASLRFLEFGSSVMCAAAAATAVAHDVGRGDGVVADSLNCEPTVSLVHEPYRHGQGIGSRGRGRGARGGRFQRHQQLQQAQRGVRRIQRGRWRGSSHGRRRVSHLSGDAEVANPTDEVEINVPVVPAADLSSERSQFDDNDDDDMGRISDDGLEEYDDGGGDEYMTEDDDGTEDEYVRREDELAGGNGPDNFVDEQANPFSHYDNHAGDDDVFSSSDYSE